MKAIYLPIFWLSLLCLTGLGVNAAFNINCNNEKVLRPDGKDTITLSCTVMGEGETFDICRVTHEGSSCEFRWEAWNQGKVLLISPNSHKVDGKVCKVILSPSYKPIHGR